MKSILSIFFCFLFIIACKEDKPKTPVIKSPADLHKYIMDETLKDYDRNTFGYDLKYIRQRKTPLLLYDEKFKGMILVSADFQGRVLTSTAEGMNGFSFGWLNYDQISAVDGQPHINAYGGEDRIWIGPEGGQFSLFFPPKSEFIYDNWQTPRAIDSEPFEIISISQSEVALFKRMNLKNYANTSFDIAISRRIKLITAPAYIVSHGMAYSEDLKGIGFESENILRNAGQNEWTKTTGMPSIWILGMFKPNPSTTVVIPYKGGPDATMGKIVTDDYFGKVPADRLTVDPQVLYFKADGSKRGKIGVNTFRAKPYCGSYDEERKVLTIIELSLPDTASDYVNSEWKIQEHPFAGDVVNSYNDGPLENGTQMGPFYELESSSPAAQLKPGKTLSHKHTTMHFMGNEATLNNIAKKLLGVSLEEIKNAFK